MRRKSFVIFLHQNIWDISSIEALEVEKYQKKADVVAYELGYFINKKGRYCHSIDYIKSLCKKFDYELLVFRKVPLRKDDLKDVVGGVYLLQF